MDMLDNLDMLDDLDMLDRIREIEYLEFLETLENRRKRKRHQRKDFFEELNDVDFHRQYRLTKSTVLELLKYVEKELQPDSHLNNSLNSREQLLLTLRYYATGAFQSVIGDLANVSQPTASRVIKRVSSVIALLRPKFIKMPLTEEECLKVSEKFFDIAGFPGVVGVLDCLHIPILSPGDTSAEQFRNKKGYFSINTQLVISADSKIQHVVARWPGATLDSTIFQNCSIQNLFTENSVLRQYHLLGGGDYACQKNLLTPFNQPSSPAETWYNASQLLTQNTVKKKYGILRRFPCLNVTLRCALENVQAIIVACCVLHNLAIELGDPEPPIDTETHKRGDDSSTDSDPRIERAVSEGLKKRDLVAQKFFTS